jgi:hypothetical protein
MYFSYENSLPAVKADEIQAGTRQGEKISDFLYRLTAEGKSMVRNFAETVGISIEKRIADNLKVHCFYGELLRHLKKQFPLSRCRYPENM